MPRRIRTLRITVQHLIKPRHLITPQTSNKQELFSPLQEESSKAKGSNASGHLHGGGGTGELRRVGRGGGLDVAAAGGGVAGADGGLLGLVSGVRGVGDGLGHGDDGAGVSLLGVLYSSLASIT